MPAGQAGLAKEPVAQVGYRTAEQCAQHERQLT